MNSEIETMVNIYNTYYVDWMGQSISSLSDLTRHHIVKKQNNGEDDINNYALLTTASHHLIHFLEVKYNKEYKYINSLMLDLNRSNKPPTKEYYDKILPVIKRIKKDIKNKKIKY